MAISALTNVTSDYIRSAANESTKLQEKNKEFNKVFDAALGLLNETNSLENKAESEEIKFALGYSDNTHDLMAAMTKASLALQYTVAVRDRALEAYKEIMNMQI